METLTHCEKVLDLFSSKPLSGEEAVISFRDKYEEEALGTSDTIRTAISSLTRSGALKEAGTIKSSVTGMTVKVWAINDGLTVPSVKQSKRQRIEEMSVELLRINQALTSLDGLLKKGNTDTSFTRSFIEDAKRSTAKLQRIVF
jgi:hypothetical protein